MTKKTYHINPVLKVQWERARESLPDALGAIKDASVAAIGSYAAYLARYIVTDGDSYAAALHRGEYDGYVQNAQDAVDEALAAARYAADPFWDIADRRDATSAAELLDMLAEGWRRCLEYFEGFDPMMEAQMILDLMAARITLKLEDDDDDDEEEGGAE
uniref:Uncharacterized protein n=1 Tax=Podoviridae sp. ctnCN2 TaxID=2825274 RepID=A0A8S5PM58_9CAUD|nr:MAG TPA: hypothetical protein [Podoviridae sp. ctnCN2]